MPADGDDGWWVAAAVLAAGFVCSRCGVCLQSLRGLSAVAAGFVCSRCGICLQSLRGLSAG